MTFNTVVIVVFAVLRLETPVHPIVQATSRLSLLPHDRCQAKLCAYLQESCKATGKGSTPVGDRRSQELVGGATSGIKQFQRGVPAAAWRDTALELPDA